MVPQLRTSLAFAAAVSSPLLCADQVLAFVPSVSRTVGGWTFTKWVQPRRVLSLSKDNDRARTEKNLEDMMGDDWRVFRAKLVAQEQLEAIEKQTVTRQSTIHQSQDKQQQIGSFIAGAISSMFGEKGKESQGVSRSKKLVAEDKMVETFYIGGSSIPLSDPFATEEELPTLIQPRVIVDKHRWAHPISYIEPGCVLIANEKLGGVFHQTVVLVIDHHENTGSTGIVINRPLGTLLQIASSTPSNVDLSLKLAFNSATTSYGGPVMQEDYSVLHGYGEVEGSKKVAPAVFVGGSKELMNEVRRNKFHPSKCLFVKGHAAWVPQQLSREISKGVWYVAAVSPDFILRYAGAPRSESDLSEDLWADVLNCMGGEYADIAKRHAGRGDRKMMA